MVHRMCSLSVPPPLLPPFSRNAGDETRSLCLLGMCFTTEPHPGLLQNRDLDISSGSCVCHMVFWFQSIVAIQDSYDLVLGPLD